MPTPTDLVLGAYYKFADEVLAYGNGSNMKIDLVFDEVARNYVLRTYYNPAVVPPLSRQQAFIEMGLTELAYLLHTKDLLDASLVPDLRALVVSAIEAGERSELDLRRFDS